MRPRAASSSRTRSSSSRKDANGPARAHRRSAHARFLAVLARRHLARRHQPPSFDKQFVRDYLETLDWNKTAPGRRLPPEIIAGTSAKYLEALTRLTA